MAELKIIIKYNNHEDNDDDNQNKYTENQKEKEKEKVKRLENATWHQTVRITESYRRLEYH